MKLSGEYRFEAPPRAVWTALLDPDVLAGVLPGCRRLERTAERLYEGDLHLGIGPLEGRFRGRVELSDLRPFEGYRLSLHGHGPSGHVSGHGHVTLAEDGGMTRMDYAMEIAVGGRLAAVGQRLIETSGRALARRALDRLADALATRSRSS